jgi:hypothetical protein
MSEKEKIDAYYAGYTTALDDVLQAFESNMLFVLDEYGKQIIQDLLDEAIGNKEEE